MAGGKDEVADVECFGVVGKRLWSVGLHRCAIYLAGYIADQIDLDHRVLDQQPCGADRGTRRGCREIFFPHFVESVEFGEVLEKHLCLDDVIQRRARRFERLSQVVEHIARSFLDVRAIEREVRIRPSFYRDSGFEVSGKLAGGKYQAADLECLGVGGEWLWDVGFDCGALDVTRYITDQIDLDHRVFDQQSRSPNRGARRGRREIFLPHLIEGVELLEILEEHLRLHDVIQG